MSVAAEFIGPFHDDERAAQRLAGFGSPGAAIRSFMPDPHRVFFAGLSYLFAGVADDGGWPVATILTGRPGFVSAPDPMRLVVAAAPSPDDPAFGGWRVGGGVGLLGLDLATRRRNRVGGVFSAIAADGASIAVMQSFGNCPKYIRRREARPSPRSASPIERLGGLDAGARSLIRTSDTLFVASRSREGVGSAGGFDVSHRGGPPGFVGEAGDWLAIPDYPGNRYMNTLGNLLGEPRAGLLFLDFENGDALQLQARAEIDWDLGAGRRLRLHVERGWRRRGASPLAWTAGEDPPHSSAK